MAKKKRKRPKSKRAESNARHRGGRPTDYKPEYAEQARKLCLLGATDKELADFFGVVERTINYWKYEYPEFLQSVKGGKDVADANVAESLYKRANGYEHAAIKIFADAKTGAVLKVPYIERHPPDTMACIYWLNNRQRKTKKWRQKQEHELSGPNDGPIKTQNTTKLKPDEAYLQMVSAGKRNQ